MPSHLKEIIPLTQSDCFTLFTRVKSEFDFPIHYHEEYELNFIMNGKGVKRVIGDHMEEIEDWELVMVGPNLPHAWFTHKFSGEEMKEITIQFHKDLLDDGMLRRNQLSFLRNMFNKSRRGILFSTETTKAIAPRILELEKKQGFDSVLELMRILHELSLSRNTRMLSDAYFHNNNENSIYNSRRIKKTIEHMNLHFDKAIKLGEVAQLCNMTEAAFSRFFKAKTGMTFINCLNEIRLGNASRMLIETNHSIAEIAYQCGFNNISNFNRIFKKKKHSTPKDFRESYLGTGTRVFI